MTTLLVDANNLAMRAFFAPKGDMAVGDEDTGTLVLFINILSRYIRIEQPDRLLVCWDGGGSAYRRHVYPEYKSARKEKKDDAPQPPFALIQDFLRLAGVPQLEIPGYEGDDLIAASWRACSDRSRVRILSSDKDLFQLVQDGTVQLRLISGTERPDRWDAARVEAELGCKPEHTVAMMSLMGDSSDSIPGLPRVGPKTAVKMLKEYDWDLFSLVESLPEDQQDRVWLNVALIDLSVVPIADLDEPPIFCPIGPKTANWTNLAAFCDEYELKTIKSKLETDSLWNNN